ncbi:hypothetical protein KKC1_03990 [Calderihabitans maritimus]|uniref:Uncharacterized protein n=1 Tax=Calderihabitans maritimus TaxID=1246530 RepID=A0A1Z5HPC8_9FIRM|nr:hypothetical protein KKC1_03990 [Calderihabitans maritimus]
MFVGPAEKLRRTKVAAAARPWLEYKTPFQPASRKLAFF